MRSLSKYISIVLLVLFVSAFSVQNFAAVSRDFKIEFYSLLYGKYAKAVHTPASDNVANEASPCEEETEDESETQLSPIALVVGLCQVVFWFNNYHFIFASHPTSAKLEAQHPLYLSTRTLRV